MGLHMSLLPTTELDIHSSIGFHDNINKVDLLWGKNANTQIHVDYVDDVTKIDYEHMKNNCITVNQSEKQKKNLIANARSRYNHEKKIIVYLAKASVHTRSLAKEA